jgi:hypothetical protein
MEGCPWCRGLANGIHGRAYLDSTYDAWAQGSQDSDCSGDEAQEDGLDVHDAGKGRESDDGSLVPDEDDPAGIWDLETDHDTLVYPCEFNITLSFESNGEGCYTFLNVRIESVDVEQETC